MSQLNNLVLILIFICTLTSSTASDQNFIISGYPVEIGRFVWHVILKKNVNSPTHCGGSLISEIWVLTAAHCADGLDSICLQFGTNLVNDPSAVTMTSSQIYRHPSYNNMNLNSDCALIKLPSSVPFSRNIQPIGLVPASQPEVSYEGYTVTTAGYGLTDEGKFSASVTLLYTNLIVISNEECESIYGSNIVISSTLCARGFNGTNQAICNGDSGGGLVLRDSSGYKIVAINSFVAQNKCTYGYPSGHTRITSCIGFINEKTGILPG